MSELSNKQKRYLADLARRAFNKRAAELRAGAAGIAPMQGAAMAGSRQEALDCLCLAPHGVRDLAGPASAHEAETTWRHEQVRIACGRPGLRACSQLDYKRVESHFLDLLGQAGSAFNSQVQAETEPRRQAEAVLLRELNRFGFRLSYAESISRAQFKCGVMDASVGQVWKLVYTVRNRGNARNKPPRHEEHQQTQLERSAA